MIADTAATTQSGAPQPDLFSGDAETRFWVPTGYASDARDETVGVPDLPNATRRWTPGFALTAYPMEPPGETWGSRLHADVVDPIRGLLVERRDWLSTDLMLPASFLPLAAAPGAEFQAALADLDDVINEAREEGFPPPSKDTIALAERLLRAMYTVRPCRFEVYPTQDGEVTIHASGRAASSVRVLCHAVEGVLCLVNLEGQQHRRAAYKPVATASLPDGFVREALADVGART